MSLSPVDTATTEAEALRKENEALKNRLSRLSQANIRISENLDAEAVCQEVVNGA